MVAWVEPVVPAVPVWMEIKEQRAPAWRLPPPVRMGPTERMGQMVQPPVLLRRMVPQEPTVWPGPQVRMPWSTASTAWRVLPRRVCRFPAPTAVRAQMELRLPMARRLRCALPVLTVLTLYQPARRVPMAQMEPTVPMA